MGTRPHPAGPPEQTGPCPANGEVGIGEARFDFGTLRFASGARLSPKAAHVLWLLVANPHRTLSKDFLLDTAWAGQFRVPDVLVQAIGEIRRGLGDSDREGAVLTVPKLGYRLQAAVHWTQPPRAGTPEAPADAPSSTGQRARWLRVLGLAALLLGAVLVLLPGRAPEHSPTTAGSAGRWEIHGLRRLTSEPGADILPQLDPAGARLAYVRKIGSGRYKVHLRALDGGSGHALDASPDTDDLHPAWHPDGRQLAWQRFSAAACHYIVYDLASEQARPVGGCFSDLATPMAWSEDGTALLITDRIASAQPTLHLVRLDVADGSMTMLDYSLDPARTDSLPRPGPAGRLAFQRSGGGVAELMLHDPSAAATRSILRMAGGLGGYDWLDDGSGWLLSGQSGGRPVLLVADLQGGLQVVADLALQRLQRARVGGLWVAQEDAGEAGLWSWAPDRLRPALAPGRGQDLFPTVAGEDGLLFVSDRSGHPELWLSDAEGLRQLSQRQGGALAAPLWRGDGEVWLPGLVGGRWKLLRWRSDDGSWSEVLDEERFDILDVRSDGQHLWAIAALPGQSGSHELVQLVQAAGLWAPRRTGIQAVLVRAGHGRVFVRQHLRRGVRRVDPETFELGPVIGDRHFLDWQVSADGLIHWVADDALRSSLWFTPHEGGAPGRLLEGSDEVDVRGGLAQAADGAILHVRRLMDDIDIVAFSLRRR